MSLNFLSLPAEVRYEIYKLLLVRKHEVIDPYEGQHALVPSILATNSTILKEARPLLYGHNIYNLEHFDWDREADIISEFLDNIGEANASHLKSICIAFPQLANYGDHIGPTPGNIEILEKLASACTNLKTLTLNSLSTNAIENVLAELGDPPLAAKILATIDASFKKISSLEEVVAEVSPDVPCPEVRKEMERLGWKFDPTVEVDGSSPEDWGNGRFSDESEDDRNSQDEYDDGDDGDDDDQDDDGQDDDGDDVDNDSELQRKAAD
jgi:hypothetical protein